MPANQTIQDVDIAKVLHALADRIEAGDVLPRNVTVGSDYLELYFEDVYRLQGTKVG